MMSTTHRRPDIVPVAPWRPELSAATAFDVDSSIIPEPFVVAADPSRAPADVTAVLEAFRRDPGPVGAVVLRGVPTGHVGPTPAAPTAPVDKDLVSEHVLLTVARHLGEPVGFQPEHGGRLVQHLVPTRAGADRQVSTSSRVELMFHTETAFHPHQPRYLLLLCLRGDPAAHTTLASIDELLPHLSASTRRVMCEPRFRTAVDASFLPTGHRGPSPLTNPRSLIEVEGRGQVVRFMYDADLMVGTDPAADRALDEVRALVAAHHTSIALEAGDLLVVDNHRAVHGRSSYSPRYDGTDRWLQRAFVVDSLAPSAADRTGRVITTQFVDAAA